MEGQDYDGQDRRAGITMTSGQIERIIRDAVNAGAESSAPACASCTCPILDDKHKKDHEFVDKAIKVLGRVEDIKWGVLKAVAIATVFGILALIGFKIR